jgi:hypothetical protein
MAEGRDEAPAYPARPTHPWAEIFRCFQVALDPRKLLVAAAGILLVSVGWYLLSLAFNRDMPRDTDPAYTDDAQLARKYPALASPEERRAAGRRQYDEDFAEWKVLHALAGPGGRLRTLPWYEYRGPNPYMYASILLAGSPVERTDATKDFLSATLPVLVEPLAKLLIPVARIADPHASPATRIYLLLCILWSLAVWAFAGGVITRIAAVQLTGKDRISLPQAVRFVAARYLSYLLSPVVPLGIIGVIVVGMMVFGLLALIPIVGDFLFYGLGFPLVILGGVVMAILLIGLVGYPLMYTTLSVEGSDTFDALSRSYNYVFQAPWQYLWYSAVAVVYGAAVTLFVVFVASLMVYLGKWAVSRAPLSETTNQKPDYLFVAAPDSFGWRELFLKGSPIEVEAKPRVTESGRKVVDYDYTKPAEAEAYRQSYRWWNWVGTAMVTFWLVLVFLLMLGFSYSFYWSAATVIYLLMRKKVDEVDLDEVYLEDEPELPAAPPPSAVGASPADEKPGASSLPMVPPPPATVPFAPPVSPPPAAQVTAPPDAVVTTTSVSTAATPVTPTPLPPTGPKPDDAEKE